MGLPSDGSLLCFKCGSTEHSLATCPKGNDRADLPFATCFLCSEIGHIAR
jgi:zinc finger CCHC domain-containing protein 9